MNKIRYILLLSLFFAMAFAQGQSSGFGPPMYGPPRLSGTFGELRSTHFHAGIDLKTDQVEGKPVLSVADGYISRIAVSPVGYGKVLYVNHPGGHTSVYAHLSRMKGKIEEYLHRKHYELQSYALDISVEPGVLPVRKGDTLAFSGNSGASGGPHLHFEIRETSSQATLNPLKNGFTAKDFIRPVISLLKIYPSGNGSLVKGSPKPITLIPEGWGPVYRIPKRDTLEIAGSAWFGIQAHDLLNGETNKNGIFSMSLFIDSLEVFGIEFSKLFFDKARQIHTLCDYADFQETGRRIIQTRREACNRLDIYSTLKDRGIYFFEQNRIYHLKFVVHDHFGNISVLRFVVKGGKEVYAPYLRPSSAGILFRCNEGGSFDTTGFRFSAPPEAFFDTVHFKYRQVVAPQAYFSAFHKVHSPSTALQKACTLSLLPSRVPERLKNRILAVKIDKKGKPSPAGGQWEGEWFSTQIMSFGTYSLLADTLAPTIRPVNFRNHDNIARKDRIMLRIKDDLAGIRSYRPELNGEWILMEYDAKNHLLNWYPDERVRKGQNLLKISVTDGVGNTSDAEFFLSF